MIFIVGVGNFNWWVWSVPDFDFQNLEGMYVANKEISEKISGGMVEVYLVVILCPG